MLSRQKYSGWACGRVAASQQIGVKRLGHAATVGQLFQAQRVQLNQAGAPGQTLCENWTSGWPAALYDGKTMMQTSTDLPFFETQHRELAGLFRRWATQHLGAFEANDGGDGLAAREIFRLLGVAGWLAASLKPGSPHAANHLDLRAARQLERAGWKVLHCGKNGDQGCDVLAELRGFRAVVQCKLYRKRCGDEAVQQVAGARRHYNAHVMAVVCPADFTAAAQQLAASNGVHLLHHSALATLEGAARSP